MATNSIQTGIKAVTSDKLNDYALFLGGTNVTHDVLACYDPLKTGFARLFMVRKPVHLTKLMPRRLNRFKHILEYGNIAISGIQDIQVDFDPIKGGYSGRSFDIPKGVSDSTNEISIKVYEFAGSPVREVLHEWINSSIDMMTNLATFNGLSQEDVPRIHANQTAEFILVNTDNTGEKVEHACLLANCFPKEINLDPFNYSSGEHNLVETDVKFTCVKYESIQINVIANQLLLKHKILANSLNFYSGYSLSDINGLGEKHYDIKSGKIINGAPSTNLNKAQDLATFMK